MSAWVSLRQKDTDVVKRINLDTLERAVAIAHKLDDAEAAMEGLIGLANHLAASENSNFHNKLPLAKWSVDIAKDFLAGDLVTMTEDEAQAYEARKAMQDLV